MIYQKTFPTYDDYVYLQGSKARRLKEVLLAGKEKTRNGFIRVFEMLKAHCLPEAFLCLGARCGSENEAAEICGFEGSVGIDLHPVGEKVIQADWHNLPFDDRSFRNIFTNSIDHCFDLEKMEKEIARVMKEDGCFILQIPDKEAWKTIPVVQRMGKGFEALFWDRSVDVVNHFQKYGFFWKVVDVHGSTTTYLLKKAQTR